MGDCLTSRDAQFSVSALLEASGVLLDRLRYTPYGEVSRTDGYDVTGNGIVDSGDYDTLIDPLAQANSGAGTPITASSYIAEADIDRDGVIDAADYSLCGTRDGTTTEGTKLANLSYGLSYTGPRNSVGYCGYLFNEETGHYIVRHRHYSPVLGRWLERDPAGYIDGPHLTAYLDSSPASSADPTGLFDPAGHYYGTYIAAICAGKSVDQALSMAYYAQYPDQVHEFDAYELFCRWYHDEVDYNSEEFNRWMYDIMEIVHSLDGGDPVARRQCLAKLISSGELADDELGVVLHAFGDSFAHTYRRSDGSYISYSAPWGHGADSFLFNCPDNLCNNHTVNRAYMYNLCVALGGRMGVCNSCVGRIDFSKAPGSARDRKSFKKYLPWLREQTQKEHKLPDDAWIPGDHNTDGKREITPARMQEIMDKIRCACPRVAPKPVAPKPREWGPRY